MKTPLTAQNRGFTLIEVIIALSVFVLLAAAVFGIFTATLESVAGLQDNQNRSDEADALNAYLKKSFMQIPANGMLVSYHRDGAPSAVSGVIWGDGHTFEAIDLLPQANGYYTLRMTSSNSIADGAEELSPGGFREKILNNNASLEWRALVRDVRTANWRFQDPQAQIWKEDTLNKPLLIELTIQLAGATSSATADFWIPPLAPPGNAVVAAAAPNTGASP